MSASMRALLMMVVFCNVPGAQGVRTRQAKTTPRLIAGVPLYNEHLASLSSATAEQDWIVMLKSTVTGKRLEAMCQSTPNHHMCKMHGNPSQGGMPFVVVHGDEMDLERFLGRIAGEADFIEPDLTVRLIPELPGAKMSADQPIWGLERIGADRRSYTGKDVHVYVLDTGIRTTHSDFGGRAIATLDMTSNTAQECQGKDFCAADIDGHGTHCAGTVAGTKYGVAPDATVHAVKVLGDDGSGSWSWSLTAMDWILTKGAKPAVLSMSLGGYGRMHTFATAIDQLAENGIAVVVASGNSNYDACQFTPAHVESAITVGSTQSDDARSWFSNYGKCVNIYAPGTDITSAGHQDDSASATFSGTSMACPHVSGAVALLLEAQPDLSVAQIRTGLSENAESGSLSGLMPHDRNLLLNVADKKATK